MLSFVIEYSQTPHNLIHFKHAFISFGTQMHTKHWNCLRLAQKSWENLIPLCRHLSTCVRGSSMRVRGWNIHTNPVQNSRQNGFISRVSQHFTCCKSLTHYLLTVVLINKYLGDLIAKLIFRLMRVHRLITELHKDIHLVLKPSGVLCITSFSQTFKNKRWWHNYIWYVKCTCC